MDPKTSMQNCLKVCKDSADRLRNLAHTESSQTAKDLLIDAAHHLDVAVAECNYAEYKI